MSEIPEEEQRRLDYPDDYMAQRRKLWCDVYVEIISRSEIDMTALREAAFAVRRYDSFFCPYDPTPKEDIPLRITQETEVVLNEIPDWLTEILKRDGFKREGYDVFNIGLYMDGETEIEVMVCFVNHPSMGTMIKLMHALEALDGDEIIYRVENIYNVVGAERFITSCRQFANEYKKQRGE